VTFCLRHRSHEIGRDADRDREADTPDIVAEIKDCGAELIAGPLIRSLASEPIPAYIAVGFRGGAFSTTSLEPSLLQQLGDRQVQPVSDGNDRVRA
jgi:hypothetical protein